MNVTLWVAVIFLSTSLVHAFCHGSIAARLLLFRGEFCTADSSYFRQISLHEFPNDRRSDVFVAVTQHVADACYFLPGDCRVARFQLVCEIPARPPKNTHPPPHT